MTTAIPTEKGQVVVDYQVVEEAEAIIAEAAETPKKKLTPIDVAVDLTGSRWLRTAEQEHFQEEVSYAVKATEDPDRVVRSAGFTKARELIDEMNSLIQPRWQAARALRLQAEKIKATMGCKIEDAFRYARMANNMPVYNRQQPDATQATGTNTQARKADQLAHKRARSAEGLHKGPSGGGSKNGRH